mgnify:FL=1
MDTKATLISGGYCKIGNLVIVSARIEVTQTMQKGSWLVNSLPDPIRDASLSTGAAISAATCNPNSSDASVVTLMVGLQTTARAGIFIKDLGEDMTTGTYTISAMYLAK